MSTKTVVLSTGAWFRGITFASHCYVVNCERSGVRFPECPFLVPAAKIQNHAEIRFFSTAGLALPKLFLDTSPGEYCPYFEIVR